MSSTQPWQRLVLLASGIVLAGFVLADALVSYVARGFDEPTVTVLGAGDGLSVLVTDGPARLLIANGNNATELGNALNAIRPWGRDRIDILVLIGSSDDVTFLNRASNLANARHIEIVGPESLPNALGFSPDHLLQSPRRIALSAETTVIIETVATSGSDANALMDWRITIERRGVRFVLLSDGAARGAFPVAQPATALAVAGRAPIIDLPGISPLVVIRTAATSREALSDNVTKSLTGTIWTNRVFDGDARSFRFVDRGFVLPEGGEAIDAGNQD